MGSEKTMFAGDLIWLLRNMQQHTRTPADDDDVVVDIIVDILFIIVL